MDRRDLDMKIAYIAAKPIVHLKYSMATLFISVICAYADGTSGSSEPLSKARFSDDNK